MNLRREEPEIDQCDPFKDDLLERKGLAIRLANFLGRTSGPLTLALTGSYGSGKTYFLRRCKVVFEQSKIPTILVNAWETDFASEPIAPIITELSEGFSDKLESGERLWKNAKSLAAKIAAASIPIATKLATAGILDTEDFKGGSDIAGSLETFVKKHFEHFAAAKKTIHGFKEEITKLTGKIRGSHSSPAKDTRDSPPIVVIIDELDRCRPSYAIELLEVLKHLFDIPGIVFLLGIDRKQLLSAASAVFGVSLDGDGYLRRFIDLECSLPQPDVYRFCLDLGNQDSSLRQWQQNMELHNLLPPIGRLCQGANFSLRKTYQFFVRASVATGVAAQGIQLEDMLLLVFLREYDPGLYSGFVTRKITAWELLLKLRTLDNEFGYPSYSGGYTFIPFLMALGREESPKPFIEMLKADYEKNKINASLDHLEWKSRGNWGGYLKQMVPDVDFCIAFKV